MLKSSDVVVVISNSGRLRHLAPAVEVAVHSGATIIALAPSNSQLAKRAHYTLAVEHDESSMMHIPMVSRILLLLLIDVLAVGVSLNRSSPFAELQRQAKRGILTHIASLHGESASDKITAEDGSKAERSAHGDHEVTLSPNVISHIK
ncbi:SIS domain protein [Collimonas arenae]|nr:SIS domain-containing protein [Collimonas arenae]AMP00830.1 SIS domain protein [Collimonas arenae]